MLRGLGSSKLICSLKMGGIVIALLALGVSQYTWAETSLASNSVTASSLGSVGSPTMVGSTLKMIGGLCFCLGLLAVGVRVMKKYTACQGPTRRRRIEIREKVALSGKASLFLVAVDNREYLVASGSDSTSITETHSVTTPLFAESLAELCEEPGELHA
jgi:flagellar biogenesis protein FliO